MTKRDRENYAMDDDGEFIAYTLGADICAEIDASEYDDDLAEYELAREYPTLA